MPSVPRRSRRRPAAQGVSPAWRREPTVFGATRRGGGWWSRSAASAGHQRSERPGRDQPVRAQADPGRAGVSRALPVQLSGGVGVRVHGEAAACMSRSSGGSRRSGRQLISTAVPESAHAAKTVSASKRDCGRPRPVMIRPVQCPRTSTCGLRTAATMRAVIGSGSERSLECTDATTMSSRPSRSSSWSSEPSSRMSHSMPVSSRKPGPWRSSRRPQPPVGFPGARGSVHGRSSAVASDRSERPTGGPGSGPNRPCPQAGCRRPISWSAGGSRRCSQPRGPSRRGRRGRPRPAGGRGSSGPTPRSARARRVTHARCFDHCFRRRVHCLARAAALARAGFHRPRRAPLSAGADYLPTRRTKIYAGWSRHWVVAWVWSLS